MPLMDFEKKMTNKQALEVKYKFIFKSRQIQK